MMEIFARISTPDGPMLFTCAALIRARAAMPDMLATGRPANDDDWPLGPDLIRSAMVA